ncbi:MAG: c-type cytochrome [Capsulimonas sp.]|uniref:c-type cytochrome n=1 Tax=Capsulimonas sp. TaxID=2494211 RepID=UPI00326355BE
MPEEMKGASKTTPLEIRAAGLALAAACAALGAAFGAALLIHGRTDAILAQSPPAASTPAKAAAGAGESSTQLVRGHSLFTKECVSCHGNRAQGGIGPDLRRLEISDARMAMTIKAGVKPVMPAYGSKYGDTDVQALTQYIRSLKK